MILHHKHIIIPDFTAFWVNHSQKNPIPVDWAHHAEISGGLHLRVENFFKKLNGKYIIFIHKNALGSYANKTKGPFESSINYGYIQIVRKLFKKIDEDKYFEIYLTN